MDGKRVDSPGIRVIPGQNTIAVDGHEVKAPPRTVVLLLHKPQGVVSTVSDPEGRPTVIGLCKRFRQKRRLYPVGRLDVNTTGALLITNDGMLCYRLTHPSFEVPKTYLARVRGGMNEAKLSRLRRMAGPGKRRRSSSTGDSSPVELVKQLDKTAILKITLHEGRNRQVRRMCEAVGLRIVKLKRTHFGPISVRNLPLGSVRPLTKKELDRLEKLFAAGVKAHGH